MSGEEDPVDEAQEPLQWPARVAWLRDAAAPPAPAGPAWRAAGLELLEVVLPAGGELPPLVQALGGLARALVVDAPAAALEAAREASTLPVTTPGEAAAVRLAAEVLSHLERPGEELERPPGVALVGPAAEAAGELLRGLGIASERLPRPRPRPAAGARPGASGPASGAAPGAAPGARLPGASLLARPTAAGAASPAAGAGEAAPDLATLPTSLLALALPEDFAGELPAALREAPRLVARARDPELLVLPALLRAAIDLGQAPDAEARARAARALADLAREGALPTAADPRLLPALAAAAAGEGAPAGWARALVERRSPLRTALREALGKARATPPALVLVDGEDPAAIGAAVALAQDGLCVPWLLGDSFRIEARAKAERVSLEQVKVVDPKRDKRRAAYADALVRALGTRAGLTPTRAGELVTAPLLFAGVSLLLGEAQAAVLPPGDGLDPLGALADLLPRRAPVRALSGVHLAAVGDGLLALADTAGRSDPTAEEVADAASEALRLLQDLLGRPARGALLSFTDLAPGSDPAATRLELARDVLRARDPATRVAGPLRAATALDGAALAARHPGAGLDGPAEALVLADRAGALSLVGALERLGQAEVLGTFLGGVEAAVGIAAPGAGAASLELLGAVLAARVASRPAGSPPAAEARPAEERAPRAEPAPSRATAGLGRPGGGSTPEAMKRAAVVAEPASAGAARATTTARPRGTGANRPGPGPAPTKRTLDAPD